MVNYAVKLSLHLLIHLFLNRKWHLNENWQ